MSTPNELTYSPLDSARFQRRIFRAALTTIDAAQLRDALHAEEVDTLILRISADKLGSIATLHEVGLHPIVADTHVDYEVILEESHLPAGSAPIELSAASPLDAETLRTIARSVFDGYTSHYNANPLLAEDSIADGYADWAARCTHSPATPSWLIKSRGEIVGFSCCRTEGDHARGILNGIIPSARNAGHYRSMLQAMLMHFRTDGRHRFSIATQVHNIAVQRVWAQAGLRLKHAENTVHINCNFGHAAK